METLNYLKNDFELITYLQDMLISFSTNGTADDQKYKFLRKKFIEDDNVKDLLPNFVRTKRSLSEFWQFIKYKFGTYAERRKFIWTEFNPLLTFLETKKTMPSDKTISETLKAYDAKIIHKVWTKALQRKEKDPEGAITTSRTLLESVCKFILDEKNIRYNSDKIQLSELYKKTAKELKLATEQHNEVIFKQILGGCSAVINGLGNLRNKLGDAHGGGKRKVTPRTRHAELSVNLAGAMALFLIATYNANKK